MFNSYLSKYDVGNGQLLEMASLLLLWAFDNVKD